MVDQLVVLYLAGALVWIIGILVLDYNDAIDLSDDYGLVFHSLCLAIWPVAFVAWTIVGIGFLSYTVYNVIVKHIHKKLKHYNS
jgi:hypothetical protein